MPDFAHDQVQRFLDWTDKKIELHFANREFYFSEREVWWASLGENIGSEANGKNNLFERPVIVLRKFSRDMLLAVPCTTKLKNGTWYHRYAFEGQERRAVLAQVRTISARRLIRKMGNIAPEEFTSLRNALATIIKTDPPVETGGSSDPLARTMY